MHHLCPRSQRHPSLSRGLAACQTLVRILNALATTLHGSIRTTPSIHRLRLGLLGYLIPFTPLAFVSQCQCRPSRVLLPLVFFLISTHFTVPSDIPSAPTRAGDIFPNLKPREVIVLIFRVRRTRLPEVVYSLSLSHSSFRIHV
ncbi:hypothetical protein VNO77_15367 [Canavalia gladiata]|uniref:Uncharacterized protein n=1 Tax=Canavalia gladiata TaxID=3824 RepID=A0AAN9LYX2_CANGL